MPDGDEIIIIENGKGFGGYAQVKVKAHLPNLSDREREIRKKRAKELVEQLLDYLYGPEEQ